MGEVYFLITDAAKKVNVENHVLRYWEEELGIRIKRNELGHRYYTKEDVEKFIRIKQLKDEGIQLKAIRKILDKNISVIEKQKEVERDIQQEERKMHIMIKEATANEKIGRELVSCNIEEPTNEKAMRLQYLLKQMIGEAVRENTREIYDEMKEGIIKELDYQFRIQEEKGDKREEERMKREEEHYRQVDELLRHKRKAKKELQDKDKKKHSIF